MNLQEFLATIEKNIASATRHPKYGYLFPIDEPIEIDLGDGRKSKIPFGTLAVKRRKDGSISLDDIRYLSEINPDDPNADNRGFAIPFRNLFGKPGMPLLSLLEKYALGIPLTPEEQRILYPLMESVEQIDPELVDEEEKERKKGHSVAWLTARQFLVDRYGGPMADAIMERLPPNAGMDELKKFFKENKIDVPDAFLTKEGFKKYLAKQAAEKLESFLDSTKKFDEILSNHPKAGPLWEQWKEVRREATFEAQSQARMLEMQLHGVINSDPELGAKLHDAMAEMKNGIDGFTSLAKDTDVMTELAKNSRDVLSGFDQNSKRILDDIQSFTKSDEKGMFGKTMDEIKDKLEEMMEFIRQISLAVQNFLARSFGPG